MQCSGMSPLSLVSMMVLLPVARLRLALSWLGAYLTHVLCTVHQLIKLPVLLG